MAAEDFFSLRGPRQHGRTDVDPHDLGALWIELHIASGADPGVQYPTRQTVENQPSQATVAPIFERQLEQVIEWRYPLILPRSGRHPLALTGSAQTGRKQRSKRAPQEAQLQMPAW